MNLATTSKKPTPTRRGPPPAPRHGRGGARLLVLGVLAGVVLTGTMMVGGIPNLRPEKQADPAAVESTNVPAAASPPIAVALARPGAREASYALPGTALPVRE